MCDAVYKAWWDMYTMTCGAWLQYTHTHMRGG